MRNRIPNFHELVFVIVFAVASTCISTPVCLGSWRNLSEDEKFVPSKPYGVGGHVFFCQQPDGTLFYADTANRIIRVRRPNRAGLEFNAQHIQGSDNIRAQAGRDRTIERKWYAQEPVTWDMRNMKCYGEGVILFHAGRAVQFIDNELRVIRTWKDESLRTDSMIPDPVACTVGGEIIARGERGEILHYDLEGKIKERFIIPRLYNESRVVQPKPISKLQRECFKYAPQTLERIQRTNERDAQRATERLKKRDEALPGPKPLKGAEKPTRIRGIEIADDRRLNSARLGSKSCQTRSRAIFSASAAVILAFR